MSKEPRYHPLDPDDGGDLGGVRRDCPKDDCDFTCITEEQLFRHLSSTHVRCSCDKIMNYDELPPDPDPDFCWKCSTRWFAPTEYKGKPMDFGGIINISESIMPDGEGIYYLIATGSAYVYADDGGKIQDHFIKWNENNPDVRDREDCWSSDYYGEKK